MKARAVLALALLVASSAVAAPRAPDDELAPPEPARLAPPTATPSPALVLASIDRQLADLEIAEKESKTELSDLGEKIAEAHARSLTRGRAFYRLTRAGMLPVGGGFDELVRHALRVERSRRTLANELANEQRLRQRGADLSRTLEGIARDRVALSGQKSLMDQARAAAADDSRRQEAFERAFSTSTGSSDYVAVYGGNGVAASVGGGGFAAARGRLLFPIAGRSEVRAARREGTGGPGLEIRGVLGAPVRAVYSGRVAFADRYGPYGRLVIVDHGEHYYSVSGNLASVDVKVGDEVSSGERIGSVGDEGRGPMLYFEIRHGTDTVAPAPWLGI